MPRRSRSGDTGEKTITLEQYRSASLDVLRSTGTDMSAHTSMPESQVCATKPCSGDYLCTKHRPTRKQ